MTEGWEAHIEDLLTSGFWSLKEKHLHINVTELKAAFLALQELQDQVAGHSVVVMSDNTMVAAYINKWG